MIELNDIESNSSYCYYYSLSLYNYCQMMILMSNNIDNDIVNMHNYCQMMSTSIFIVEATVKSPLLLKRK